MNIVHECDILNRTVKLDGEILFASSHQEEDESLFMTDAYRVLQYQYPKFFKMDNLCKLAFLGVETLMRKAGRLQDSGNEEMSVVMFNSSSSVDVDKKFQSSMESVPSPSLFVYTLPNVMIGEICIRYKIYGENYLFITEDYDRETLMERVKIVTGSMEATMILLGYADYHTKAEGHFMLIQK